MKVQNLGNECPRCEEAGTLEFGGKVWLDDVWVIHDEETGTFDIHNALPSSVADDPETGLVWSAETDVYLRCKACDYELPYSNGASARAFFEDTYGT